MSEVNIAEGVKKCITKQLLDEEKTVSETDKVADLGFDSLDIVELTMELEDEFDLDAVNEAELNESETVGDIITLISQKIALTA